MAQDLRDMFKKPAADSPKKLPKGHEKRFIQKLDEHFNTGPIAKKSHSRSYKWYKIAAVFVVLIALGALWLRQPNSVSTQNQIASETPSETEAGSMVFLSDVSPEYKKIEDYYLSALHTELAQLDVTDENKLLVDSFMAQLAELDKEYQRLNADLGITGVNEETISALIENLTLRLDLLFKLKMKLKEFQETSHAM